MLLQQKKKHHFIFYVDVSNLLPGLAFIGSGVSFSVYFDESICKVQSEMMMKTISEFQ